MHTSRLLSATDFCYRHRDGASWRESEFADFCPNYHPLDRVGVVSPCLEDGIQHASAALLALTTAFYDALRARGGDFYDYPQHFALLVVDEGGVQTRAGHRPFDAATVGRPWGHLDVWPDTNWIATAGSAAAMLRKVFELQIHRLFWPESLRCAGALEALPGTMRRLLLSRLKSVYYYNVRQPDVEIHAAGAATKIIRESRARLPHAEEVMDLEASRPRYFSDGDAPDFHVERHRRVTAREFLGELCGN